MLGSSCAMSSLDRDPAHVSVHVRVSQYGHGCLSLTRIFLVQYGKFLLILLILRFTPIIQPSALLGSPLPCDTSPNPSPNPNPDPEKSDFTRRQLFQLTTTNRFQIK